ncbi:MBL fold metallo-hydrolase [Halioxenophilus sp. WMMB6]|uniref:MBL fold metallo-hydrolase n=1 Tax=Halioxenophilus sp. WMMB6 TaxID=3073815 RepID=UPI00295F0063|nr:MBL fold metallo-hydrolase [Halioxenophilus sp. WMMB6]
MDLNHINVWLLEDHDGWTIVDTGLDVPESRAVWQQLFQKPMASKPIKRVICTHMHPDHIGLAGWLSEQFNAELWMTRSEFLMCKVMVMDTGRPAPELALKFYRTAGYTEEQIADYKDKFGNFGKLVFPMPDSYRRLVDQETFQIGGNYWQVIVGTGHSPEHACLYCPALKLLISGDQVLPKITSNVSVFPTEPHGNPLNEWLTSCNRLQSKLPDDLLVLPAHETPFYGLHIRLTQLIESHRRDLLALYQHLDQPRRAVDCFPPLFKKPIGPETIGFATGEALAHLNYLVAARLAQCETDSQGVNWYRQRPESIAFDRF